MRSIERFLLAWIAGTLSLGLTLVALVGYLVTLDEMEEVFDAELRNVAAAVASVQHPTAGGLPVLGMPAAPDDDDDLDDDDEVEESDIVTLSWTSQGRLVFASDPAVVLPFTTIPGPSIQQVGAERWSVYTMVLADGVVQTAQRSSARREMAGESAAKILPPMLVLAVIVSGLLVYALRRGLDPLDLAARDVAERSEASLAPIPTDRVPREILPLVTSVNGLMERLASALSAQRRFLADAAHELRTPATALRLQLQLLERSHDEATRAAALRELRAGVERTQHLIEQLLQVARSGADGEPMRRGRVDLSELVRSVVGSMSLKAEDRAVDLGAQATEAVFVDADAGQLVVLTNNLVENALRHSPAGGTVDVGAALREGRPLLYVRDDGPGIPAAERERVFDRFYRGTPQAAGGSGLGLAIVRAIAERHGARVSLGTPASGRGLEVSVEFQAPAKQTPPAAD